MRIPKGLKKIEGNSCENIVKSLEEEDIPFDVNGPARFRGSNAHYFREAYIDLLAKDDSKGLVLPRDYEQRIVRRLGGSEIKTGPRRGVIVYRAYYKITSAFDLSILDGLVMFNEGYLVERTTINHLVRE